MTQEPLPMEYSELSTEECAERITQAKHTLGKRLVILGHHYQREEIIVHADYRGDSFKLAQHAASHPDSEFIVFCGVHFMAESADILTPESQKVILPNLSAGCSMADMANIFQVRNCWKQLQEIEPNVYTPVTYINSAANLKAFVGENGGTVCTSSNADKAIKWALGKNDKVLFFPDQHLGRNTAVKMGYDPEQDMCVWDPFKPLGGNTKEKILNSKFILWKGWCSVHARFNVEQINKARTDHPDVNVIVHPECTLDVVKAADFDGSTEFILKTITNAPSGTVWAVGTEINLVSRIAREQTDKIVYCLDPQICPCSTMYRIHPSFLCWTLENLVKGNVVNHIVVPEPTRSNALIALNRMLEL